MICAVHAFDGGVVSDLGREERDSMSSVRWQRLYVLRYKLRMVWRWSSVGTRRRDSSHSNSTTVHDLKTR